MSDNNTKNFMIAAVLIAIGIIVGLGSGGKLPLNGFFKWKIFLLTMGLGFLGKGIYGLISGRVYGRSLEKYWGGWLYRDAQPIPYWSYVILDVLVGMVLLIVPCGG